MVKPAPVRFNPDLLLRDGTRYQAAVPLSQFPRLVTMILTPQGNVDVTFSLSRRKDHIVITGQFAVSVPMQCQRCLEPMQCPVGESFELTCVENETIAQALPDRLDPVVLDEKGLIHLVDLLEDELLLRVPSIAMHEPGAVCQMREHEFGGEAVEQEEKRANPFAALKDLKLN